LATFGIHHTEEVPFGVREHHEVGAIGVYPIHVPGTERYEPLDFGPLLLLTGDVQVEMGSIGLVQQEGWAFAALRHEGARVITRTRYIAKSVAPEGCCPVDVGHVQHQ
jgi:hypothetical protein